MASKMASMGVDSLVNLLGAGFSVYSHHKSLKQEKALHEEECAIGTEQHFQALSTDMLSITKEADRDVWEQRNNQFNNMLVCATLMFGVPINNINQGAYQPAAETAAEEAVDPLSSPLSSSLASLFTKDGARAAYGALPHRAPSSRCTADLAHRVRHRTACSSSSPASRSALSSSASWPASTSPGA